MRKILVTGYPRSGNTWLARLVASALNCSIVGSGPNRRSLAAREGESDEYVVIQDHLRYAVKGPFIQAPRWCNPKERGDSAILYVERDPRDVAVSAFHYWQRPSLIDTISLMRDGRSPFGWGPWLEFVTNWRAHPKEYDYLVQYEWLHENAMDGLSKILDRIGAEPELPLHEVARRNSFASLRLDIINHPEALEYPPDVNLRHLRRGYVGDWRSHFNRRIGQFAHQAFWPAMKAMGYETDEAWWEKLPVEPLVDATRGSSDEPNPKQGIW